MPVIVGVALGGALGASARYLLGQAVGQRGSAFPWTTFAINLTGCFLIGVITASLVDRQHLPPWLRVGLVVGVIGGYTTFSAFAQESLILLEARELALTFLYAVGSVTVGIAFVYLGTLAGRSL